MALPNIEGKPLKKGMKMRRNMGISENLTIEILEMDTTSDAKDLRQNSFCYSKVSATTNCTNPTLWLL